MECQVLHITVVFPEIPLSATPQQAVSHQDHGHNIGIGEKSSLCIFSRPLSDLISEYLLVIRRVVQKLFTVPRFEH
jgi:hypothetical protein